MKNFLLAISVASIIWGVTGCASPSHSNVLPEHESPQASAPKKTMRAFRSEQELRNYFRQLAEKRKQESRYRAKEYSLDAAPAAPAKMVAAEAQEESVTNVQHAGVDEGGIVKVHGNHLVVLRRGRLFTVSIDDGALEPISSVDAFAPDIDPRSTWYDEMLVSKDTVA